MDEDVDLRDIIPRQIEAQRIVLWRAGILLGANQPELPLNQVTLMLEVSIGKNNGFGRQDYRKPQREEKIG